MIEWLRSLTFDPKSKTTNVHTLISTSIVEVFRHRVWSVLYKCRNLPHFMSGSQDKKNC